MTSKEFISGFKEIDKGRPARAFDEIRQALKAINVYTTASSATLNPRNAAWLIYAFALAPGSRRGAEIWARKFSARFSAKEKYKEMHPIAGLQILLTLESEAAACDRAVIDLVQGDLHVIAPGSIYFDKEHTCYVDFLEDVKGRENPVIHRFMQIDGAFFQAFHDFKKQMN